ncbi:DUF2690 domain-containing protein [Streptomyces sp. NPDC048514]|uniref:helix-turn-helix domain-containing protein n=1 Tax=Streptomyces sp. NPDC048514 TaxID=3365564 RepID=UPI003712AB5F
MPRWKALPEDLDPQIAEFTSQLRRLVDRSGLSVAALADSTGYGKASWERYLGGRLLAPKGAIVALAEATGTNPVHLVTLWELAERAWSRAEMRHDRTMEAMRIAQARAALGESGTGGAAAASGAAKAAAASGAAKAGGASAAAKTGGTGKAGGWPSARKNGGSALTPGVAGPAGVSPTFPGRPAAPGAGAGAAESDNREVADGGSRGPSADGGATGAGSGGNSWGLAGYRGPSPASARPGAGGSGNGSAGAGAGAGADASVKAGAGAGAALGAGSWTRPPVVPEASAGTPGGRSPNDGRPQAPGPAGGPPGAGSGRRRVTMFLAGLVGVLVVIAAVFFFTERGDRDGKGGAAKSPSPAAGRHASLPPGVKCAGAACTGKDAEAMGCSGDLVTTAESVTVGTATLEVRYSKTCGTAWGRVTGAVPGDEVRVSAGGAEQKGTITSAGDTIAYTPMVAVKNAAQAKSCATLASGATGCTR